MNNTPKRIPYINPRATKHLRVRLVPEIRSAIEEEAETLKTSMTNVTLSALRLYFRQRKPKDEQETGFVGRVSDFLSSPTCCR